MLVTTIIAVDTMAPVAPTVAISTAGSQVVSVVNEQDVASGLVISGTKEAGSSIDIDFASGAHTISVAADESASWSHSLARRNGQLVSAVGQGVAGSSISYVVTATDAVGNTSQQQQVLVLTRLIRPLQQLPHMMMLQMTVLQRTLIMLKMKMEPH